ncbi:hypothetical protein E2K98_06635 [Bacillus salipaludis]|uniref:Uncharacterized protein n=1 Tax=Bacillus salipaludis TaxID=2547811 RepID=A0A4R5VVG1_9BACI|nr:hypothetical protein [Bacillus salipaludis]MDQ6597448.1 hypothetical protein [Bacillus salipaludis]TDK63125.1 hypothetical protein E2K98_06635 [Bacillus salipaludis]
MGLYFDHNKFPELYKNTESIQEPNQQFSRNDALADLLEEQKKELERMFNHVMKTMDEKNVNLRTDIEHDEQMMMDMLNQVLTRLDRQEALTEKILRQINHIRSILFERTNYLATKIEDGYKVTSTYVYKLMTGSEQPLTFLLRNDKKEESK